MATRKQPPTSLWQPLRPETVAPGEFEVLRPKLAPTSFTVGRSALDSRHYVVRLWVIDTAGFRYVVALMRVDASTISSRDELNALGENLLLLYRLTHCKSD